MKKSLLAAAAAAGILCSLTACASDYAYGPPAAYADVDFMGYYDDFYGPFYGGYWGPRGYFYYSDGVASRFRRDAGRHFRSQSAPGFHPIQGHAPSPTVRGHAEARSPHP